MTVRIPTADAPLKLAVLISGGGRTMVNLHEQIVARGLPALIGTVISSRPTAGGNRRAMDLGLPLRVVEPAGRDDFHERLYDATVGADLVCMAGFTSFWQIPVSRLGSVINIHPALLPQHGGKGMYGSRVHAAVLAAGDRESGCTVHFCDNEYDHGPVILQRRVPVEPDDDGASLAARVFEAECEAYPTAIEWFCRGRVKFLGDRAEILDGA